MLSDRSRFGTTIPRTYYQTLMTSLLSPINSLNYFMLYTSTRNSDLQVAQGRERESDFTGLVPL